MRFAKLNLHVALQSALEDQGYNKTTDIQYKAIRSILNGSDVLAIAQTGTGKTAAYLIPIIHRLYEARNTRGLNCLILVPTRELAIQVGDFIRKFTSKKDLPYAVIYGGVEQDTQINKLLDGVHILVCTPGRFFDLKSQGFIHLDSIKTFVIDEADQMLRYGFYRDVITLARILPKNRQTLYFSATIDDEVKKLAYTLVNNPIRIEISPDKLISGNITHYKVSVAMDDKRFFLERLINEYAGQKVMVFVRTQVRAERIQAAMARVNIECVVLHGAKEQQDRLEALDAFRTGKVLVLISTDVAARGIDIPSVEVVVNYDVPDVTENYVHRIGRTGRGMAKGVAFTYVDESENELIEDIEEYINLTIDTIDLDNTSYEEIKLIKDPNAVSMDDISRMIDDNEKNFNTFDSTRKKQKLLSTTKKKKTS